MRTKTNEAGRELIKAFEALRLVGYDDGGGVPTIGWGHTGPDVKIGQRITEEQAEALFLEDLAEAEQHLDRYLKAPTTPNQYAALVSFMFNLGPDQVGKSTLLRWHNARDYRGASTQFERWVYDNGRRLRGLERRRKAERALYLKP